MNLTLNPWSWSRVASVLYLDSPAGVVRMQGPCRAACCCAWAAFTHHRVYTLQGLSYSEDASDYATTDTITAQDSYAFLQQFFQLFKDFAALPLYITGARCQLDEHLSLIHHKH